MSEEKGKKQEEKEKVVAIIRVRGRRNIKPRIKKTLHLLSLYKVNHAVVKKLSPSLKGMLQHAKDYITWGEIEKETLIKLIKKRGEKGAKKAKELYSDKEIEEIADEIIKKGKTEKIDKVFRLHPPRRGWKSIKHHYPRGALGRRDNMDELIRRMI